MPVSLDLIRYYSTNDEASRHLRQQLEFELTLRFFDEWLPKTKSASILEVGAGSGYYTKWLLERGYQVVSIEPTPDLVKYLEALKQKYSKNLVVIQGDDKSLVSLDQKFDRILLMGPLYHLFQEEDRIALLKNARSKLVKDGQIFSVLLSRVGFLSYLIKNHPELLSENPEAVGKFIQNGFDDSATPSGHFRGNFDSLQSAIELHQKAGATILKFISLDPIIGPHDEHFNNLKEGDKPFWSEVAYHLSTWPETLGSARTWGFVSQ
jgi:SAM-dependent methyltransferase